MFSPEIRPAIAQAAATVRRRLTRTPMRTDADVYLVEIKAAAIDLVAEAAMKRGAEVVFADNEVVCDGLDEAVLDLVPGKVPA